MIKFPSAKFCSTKDSLFFVLLTFSGSGTILPLFENFRLETWFWLEGHFLDSKLKSNQL